MKVENQTKVPERFKGKVKNLSDLVGDLMEFWGFRRPLGQIWTWLYFTEAPLSATELQETLELSAGTISTSLKELRHWGVVRLLPRPGKNADVFTAEHDIMPIVLKVLRERELELISRTIKALEDAATLKDKSGEGVFFSARVEKLLFLARAGYGLLSTLLSLRSPDFEALRRALSLQPQ